MAVSIGTAYALSFTCIFVLSVVHIGTFVNLSSLSMLYKLIFF